MDAWILNGQKISPAGAGKRLRLDAPVASMLARPEVQERLAQPEPIELYAGMTGDPEVVSIEALTEKGAAEALALTKVKGTREPPPDASTKTMRLRHHHLARLLAAGLPPKQAGAAAGFPTGVVNTIQASPAFQNLLLSYMQAFDKAALDMKMQLEAAASVAVTELHERLVNTPESFNNETLRKTVETLADRSGHGPTSKVVSTSVALTPADIRALKLGLAPAVLEAEVVDVPREPDGGEAGTLGPVRGADQQGLDAGAKEGAEVPAVREGDGLQAAAPVGDA